MSVLTQTEICYLLAFPDEVETKTPAEPVRGLKNAPYFQPVDIRLHTLGVETLTVDEVTVTATRQRYEDQVQIVECRFKLPDPLSLETIQRRQKIEEKLQEKFLPAQYRAKGLFEVYIVLLVKDVVGVPDQFVEANTATLARFIRSQHEILDASEIDEILVSRLRYSKDDLTLVDW